MRGVRLPELDVLAGGELSFPTAWRTVARPSSASTDSIGGKVIACEGQVLAQLVQPTMQFSGSTTTGFLRSKSKR